MKIRAASKRMNDLLEIHMARCCPDAEVLEFNAHHCNVNILLTNIADDLQGAELHSVELSTGKLPDNFDCDGQLVCILVRNLVTNAYHHGDPNKPIQLEIFGTRTNGLRISVHNSGACIPQEDLPHIFNAYYRGLGAHDRSGSGLGLYLVKRITMIHRGRIHVKSSDQFGTKFSVFLRSIALPHKT
jgi:signal transduction histidine kinase